MVRFSDIIVQWHLMEIGLVPLLLTSGELSWPDSAVKIPPHLTQSTETAQYRVKSGIFGQTAKFGQPPCLFHSSVIGIKNKLTKQTVKILMTLLLRSRLIWISTVCKCVSEFT